MSACRRRTQPFGSACRRIWSETAVPGERPCGTNSGPCSGAGSAVCPAIAP
jgi:hypothetical protein